VSIPVWVWVSWAILVSSAVVTTIAYRRLMRALEDAVVLVFESGMVQSFDCTMVEVHLNSKKAPSAEALVVADRIVGTARAVHKRWLAQKMQEYLVRWTVDGVRTRSVQ